ncbi:hypothetical protein MPSEU_000826400 [Mayamaea pseudoterrestris]|nr:hypothetical protein MPSEU_000826400 [Mayamaea pseudoterrestris]
MQQNILMSLSAVTDPLLNYQWNRKRRRRCHEQSSMMMNRGFLSMLLLLILGMSLPVAQSQGEKSWIDPDTPHHAQTTRRYNIRLGPAPPPTPKPTSKPRKRRKPTTSPRPTVSTQPSYNPSSSPTDYPTFDASDKLQLVFSDEFNVAARTFDDGTDPRWTSLHKNDYTNDALHYYSPEHAYTNADGQLVIESHAADTNVVGFDDLTLQKEQTTKHFTSAMLQSWNKFCFTGGIIEAKVQLPGNSQVGGLWPAFWLLGNLARHTYVGSSQHVWPWSSIVCTEKSGYAQQVSGCDAVAHYGMAPFLGRGAPEIDIFEVQPGNIKANTGVFLKSPVGQPFMSASYQVAPGRPANRPGDGEWPGPGQWYKGLLGGRNASLNIGFYGTYNHFLNSVHPAQQDYWSDAISYNNQLAETHFNSSHVYRLEWDVPTDEKDGYLHWFLDGKLVLAINGSGIKDAGLGTTVSSEPSYIILNTAISKQWGFPRECPPSCPCKKYDCNSHAWQDTCGFSEGFCDMIKQKEPPKYKIDWIRVYQDPNMPEQKVGCSTPERPTRQYIEAHAHLYKQESDARPLKDIQRGLGACVHEAVGVNPESCGGEDRGRCTKGNVCECNDGWTGPHCLAHDGQDSILWDEPDKISDVGFVPPLVAPKFLLGILIVLGLSVAVSLQCRRRLEGWTPLSDVDKKLLEQHRRSSARIRHQRQM